MKSPKKIFWLTGLSGAGKTTLADALTALLQENHQSATMIDGDVFRKQYCQDLGFSTQDRHENLMRMSDHALKLSHDFDNVIVAAISPLQKSRDTIRNKLKDSYIEIFVDTPLSICEARDVKGLYAKARNGELENFTGISSEYQRPRKPEVVIAYPISIEQALRDISLFIQKKYFSRY